MNLRISAAVTAVALITAACGAATQLHGVPNAGAAAGSGIVVRAQPAAPDDAIAGNDLGRANANAPRAVKTGSVPAAPGPSSLASSVNQRQTSEPPVVLPPDRCSAPVTAAPGKPRIMLPACAVQ